MRALKAHEKARRKFAIKNAELMRTTGWSRVEPKLTQRHANSEMRIISVEKKSLFPKEENRILVESFSILVSVGRGRDLWRNERSGKHTTVGCFKDLFLLFCRRASEQCNKKVQLCSHRARHFNIARITQLSKYLAIAGRQRIPVEKS